MACLQLYLCCPCAQAWDQASTLAHLDLFWSHSWQQLGRFPALFCDSQKRAFTPTNKLCDLTTSHQLQPRFCSFYFATISPGTLFLVRKPANTPIYFVLFQKFIYPLHVWGEPDKRVSAAITQILLFSCTVCNFYDWSCIFVVVALNF